MRKPFIAGNWKMHKTINEATDYGELFVQKLKDEQVDFSKVDVALFVPYIHMSALKVIFLLRGIDVGAQNMFYEEKGAFTGEISPTMLSDLGIERVIIGHSERRKYFGETSAACAKKLNAAYTHDIKPVLCVGEDLKDREAGRHKDAVRTMLLESFEGIHAEEAEFAAVAYEPLWAIGTGKTATPEQAEEMAALIRSVLAEKYGSAVADNIIIQYGGSVNEENIAELMAKEDIDGALVGGASLDAAKFAKIVAFDDSVRKDSLKQVSVKNILKK
ncbi:MAG: triose-phosphate isomerase [Eubacteriales bacterium]|nr:triose-phosphate isomerase [Eubacteriales bacterium]